MQRRVQYREERRSQNTFVNTEGLPHSTSPTESLLSFEQETFALPLAHFASSPSCESPWRNGSNWKDTEAFRHSSYEEVPLRNPKSYNELDTTHWNINNQSLTSHFDGDHSYSLEGLSQSPLCVAFGERQRKNEYTNHYSEAVSENGVFNQSAGSGSYQDSRGSGQYHIKAVQVDNESRLRCVPVPPLHEHRIHEEPDDFHAEKQMFRASITHMPLTLSRRGTQETMNTQSPVPLFPTQDSELPMSVIDSAKLPYFKHWNFAPGDDSYKQEYHMVNRFSGCSSEAQSDRPSNHNTSKFFYGSMCHSKRSMVPLTNQVLPTQVHGRRHHTKFFPNVGMREAKHFFKKRTQHSILARGKLRTGREQPRKHKRTFEGYANNIEDQIIKRVHQRKDEVHDRDNANTCRKDSEQSKNGLDHLESSETLNVGTVSVPATVEVEEGELVDESDDEEMGLVMDEMEAKNGVISGEPALKQQMDEKPSSNQSSSPLLFQSLSLSLPSTNLEHHIQADISQRIEAEIMEAKEASSRMCMNLSAPAVVHKDQQSQIPGRNIDTSELYPIEKPELIAEEILKQHPNFLKQLYIRTEQPFSSFTFLWKATAMVACTLQFCDLEEFSNFVQRDLPDCYLKDALKMVPFNIDLFEQELLYRKEVEFFRSSCNLDMQLWKRNILLYYRKILQYSDKVKRNKSHPSTKSPNKEKTIKPLGLNTRIQEVEDCSQPKETNICEVELQNTPRRRDECYETALSHCASEDEQYMCPLRGSAVKPCKEAQGYHPLKYSASEMIIDPGLQHHNKPAENPRHSGSLPTEFSQQTRFDCLSATTVEQTLSVANCSVINSDNTELEKPHVLPSSFSQPEPSDSGNSGVVDMDIVQESPQETTTVSQKLCPSNVPLDELSHVSFEHHAMHDNHTVFQRGIQYAPNIDESSHQYAVGGNPTRSERSHHLYTDRYYMGQERLAPHSVPRRIIWHTEKPDALQQPVGPAGVFNLFAPVEYARGRVDTEFGTREVDVYADFRNEEAIASSNMTTGMMYGHNGNEPVCGQHIEEPDRSCDPKGTEKQCVTDRSGKQKYQEYRHNYDQSRKASSDEPYDPELPIRDLDSAFGSSIPHLPLSMQVVDHDSFNAKLKHSGEPSCFIPHSCRELQVHLPEATTSLYKKNVFPYFGMNHVRPQDASRGNPGIDSRLHRRKRMHSKAPNIPQVYRPRSGYLRSKRVEKRPMHSDHTSGGVARRRLSTSLKSQRNNRHRHERLNQGELSDEDLEVLELRKQAIMSIVNNIAEKKAETSKLIHKSRYSEDKPPAGDTLENVRPLEGGDGAGLSMESELQVKIATSSKQDVPHDTHKVTGAPSPTKNCAIDIKGEMMVTAKPVEMQTLSVEPSRFMPVPAKIFDSPVPSPVLAVLRGSEQDSTSRSASPSQKLKTTTAIKVFPRDSQTHKVQDFCILVSNASDSSESENDSAEPVTLEERRAVQPPEAINQLSKLKQKNKLIKRKSGNVQLLSSSRQKEYNELKMKLALHKNRLKVLSVSKTKASQKCVMQSKSSINVHVPASKRSSNPEVLRTKLLKVDQSVTSVETVRLVQIKERIKKCEALLKNHRSAVEHETLVENELVESQNVLKQEMDESTLRIELLEKKLKDAREEHIQWETKLTDIGMKLSTTQDEIARHQSWIKEKENEIRLLQRKADSVYQKQNQQLCLESAALQEANNIRNGTAQRMALVEELPCTDQSKPTDSQYESVSDTEVSDGNCSSAAFSSKNPQLSAEHDGLEQPCILSPLETEMVSDTEMSELSESAQFLSIRTIPVITVEAISEGKKDSGAKSGVQTSVVTSENANFLEQVSDTEQWHSASSEGSQLVTVEQNDVSGSGNGEAASAHSSLETPGTKQSGLLYAAVPSTADVLELKPSLIVPIGLPAEREFNHAGTLVISQVVPNRESSTQFQKIVPNKSNSRDLLTAVIGQQNMLTQDLVESSAKLASRNTLQQNVKQPVPLMEARKIRDRNADIANQQPLISLTAAASSKGLVSSSRLQAGKIAIAYKGSMHSSSRLLSSLLTSQKSAVKGNPKRLVHSKAAELRTKLQKELKALEKLQAARKTKALKSTVEPSTMLKKTGNSVIETSGADAVCSRNIGSNGSATEAKEPVCGLFESKVEIKKLVDQFNMLQSLSQPFEITLVKTKKPLQCIPEHVISLGLKQMRHQMQFDKTAQPEVPNPSSYTSPLLIFHSYRLSKHFSKFVSLTSLTYSNKIDPLKLMCRFELLGTCNDTTCQAQHFRDIKPSKDEMVKDLVSYCPALAGCSSDATSVDDKLPESQQKIAMKMDAYVKSLIDGFSSKSDEQLCTYVAHKVMLGRKEIMGTSGIELYEHLQPSGLRRNPKTKPLQTLATTFASISDEATMVFVSDANADTSSGIQRYFTDNSPSFGPQKPVDASGWVKRSKELADAATPSEACNILMEALYHFPDSEEIWVQLLQFFSISKSGNEKNQNEIDGLCSRALQSCPSYAVIFQCIGLGLKYTAKQKLIVEGFKTFMTKNNCTTAEEQSHCILELFLNAILLEQICGNIDKAEKIWQDALLPNSDKDASTTCIWRGVEKYLNRNDLALAVLCYGHFIYHSCLPVSGLFGHATSCPPARIARKEPFLIPLDSQQVFEAEKHHRIVHLLQGILVKIITEVPSCASSMICNILCENIVHLEVIHGSPSNAQAFLHEVVTLAPTAEGAWLMLAKLEEQQDVQKCIDILSSAVKHCPQSPNIYAYAASLCLASRSIDEAITWLKNCIAGFYEVTVDTIISLDDTFLLCRKLLGQLVPYQYSFPSFSNSVDVKKLDMKLVFLWKCYILLVKCTQSVAHQDYFHASVEDAFESAVHSVHDQFRIKFLWMEYLTHLKLQALNSPTAQNFKSFFNCVERCLDAVKCCGTYTYQLTGESAQYWDYSFHNKVLNLFLECFPFASTSKVIYVHKFFSLLPKNSGCVNRIVQYALEQSPEDFESAQTALANYLVENPTCCMLWKMYLNAIALELRLGHSRQARWMFQQATAALPFQADLWNEFLQFELYEHQQSRSNPSIISWLVERCKEVGLDLKPFAKQMVLQSRSL